MPPIVHVLAHTPALHVSPVPQTTPLSTSLQVEVEAAGAHTWQLLPGFTVPPA
jgi:hypothetical protein